MILTFDQILREANKKVTMTVYHSSFYKNDDLDPGKRSAGNMFENQCGVWFTPDMYNAATYGPYLMECEITFKNSIGQDYGGKNLEQAAKARKGQTIHQVTLIAQHKGYDCLYVENVKDSGLFKPSDFDKKLKKHDTADQIVVFDKKQIKVIKRMKSPYPDELYEELLKKNNDEFGF